MTKASQARAARRKAAPAADTLPQAVELPAPAVKARRKPGPKAKTANGDGNAPELSAEQQVTILAQQVSFLRNQYFLLAQRYGGNAVSAQTMTWEGATNFINGEMQNLDAALNQIAAAQQ